MQGKKPSLFAFLKIAILWDRFNFISNLKFDTILGAVLLYQWLLRFVFKENGFKFISKTNPDLTVPDPVSSSTRKWSDFSDRLEPEF